MPALDRRVIAREQNIVRVDFRRESDPSAPTFPGAGALRQRVARIVDALTPSLDRMETAMRKGLLAASLAGVLVAPQIGAALASDSDRSIARTETRMLLPMPQQDSVPWLNTGFSLIVPKQYLMIGPRIDSLGPLLLPPAVPPTQFSSSAHTSLPIVATE